MIGLFFGETLFPKLILKNIKKKKLKYLIIDLSKKNIFKKNSNSYRISIGQFGKILKILNQNKCNKVIFAGKIEKPKFSELKLDATGIYYIPRIIKAAKKGDAAILKELIKILGENKIKVLKLNKFNPELTLKKGTYSKLKPNLNQKREINKGIRYLYSINSHNHVQAAVIRNNKLISYEKKQGTQSMLSKISKVKKNNGFLIKFPKKKQDLRADLPTIGFDTIKECKRIGLRGIVLKNNQHIILDKKKIIEFSNKNKMILHVI